MGCEIDSLSSCRIQSPLFEAILVVVCVSGFRRLIIGKIDQAGMEECERDEIDFIGSSRFTIEFSVLFFSRPSGLPVVVHSSGVDF